MSIKYKNFSVRNGGCILEANMPLENQGLVLIQGVNRDEGGSNGSGKSTLFDLLAASCTGKTGKSSGSRSLKKNDLLNLKNPRNFHTQLVFQKKESEYIVNHYRSHEEYGTRIEILVDGVDETPTTTLDKVQDKVTKILGFTPDEFYGQVYLSQQYSHALVHGTPAEKRKYLSLYFGLDSIDLMFTLSKKRVESVVIPNERELVDLQESIQQQLQNINEEEALRAKLTEVDDNKAKLQKRVLDLRFIIENQNKAKKVEEKSQEWEIKLAKLDIPFTVDDLKQEISSTNQTLATYKAELRRLVELEKVTLELETLGVVTDASYQSIREDIVQYEKDINEKTEAIRKLEVRESLEGKLAVLPKTDKSWRDLVIEAGQKEKEAKAYTANLNSITVELKKLSFKGKECPTCLRSISSEEHQEMISSREHKHSVLKPYVDSLLEEVRQAKLMAEAKEQEIVLLSELKELPEGEVNQAREELALVIKTKKSLQSLADSLVKHNSLQDRAVELKSQDPGVNKSKESIKGDLSILETKASILAEAKDWLLSNGQIKFDMVAYGLALEEIILQEDRLNKATEESLLINNNITTRQQLTKQLNDVTVILSRNNVEKNRRRVLEVINVSLGDIRKYKLKQATEVLTSILPFYIKQLFPEGNVRVFTPEGTSEFDLFLDKGNQKISLYAASGGQAKRVVLAIFFAFSQMGAKSSNILLGDEIFKDLDPRGREATYDIIRDLNIPSIFVTSHDNDLSTKNKYDQVWSMVMENDTSTLKK